MFRAHGRLCALPVKHVIETMRARRVEPIASAPPCVIGLARLRGAGVPVVDLGRMLDGEDRPLPAGWLVTLRIEERVVALAVDTVVGVRALPADTVRDLPPLLGDARSEAVMAVGSLDHELLLVLRAARLAESLEGLQSEAPS